MFGQRDPVPHNPNRIEIAAQEHRSTTNLVVEPRGPTVLADPFVPKTTTVVVSPATFVVATPPFFGDIGKEAKDLFSKDFPNTNKIELTYPKFSANLTKQDDRASGALTVKNTSLFNPLGGLLSTTVDTNALLKLEWTKDKIADGVKLVLTGEYNVPNNTQGAKVNVEVKKPSFAMTFNTSLEPQKGFSATSVLSSITFPLPRVSGAYGGIEGELSLGTRSFKKVQVQATHRSFNYVFTLFSILSGQALKDLTVGTSVYYKPIGSVFTNPEVAAQVEVKVYQPKDSVTVIVAGAADVADNSRAKVKVDTRLNGSFSFAHKLNRNVKLTLGTDVDVRAWQFKKTGLTLTFSE